MVPDLFARLPEQYFTGVLAAVAAEAAWPRVIDLGRGNPDLPPPAHAIEALRAAAKRSHRRRRPRLPALPGSARAPGGHHATRCRAGPRAGGGGRPGGRRRGSCSSRSPPPGRATACCCRPRLSQLPLGRRAGGRPGDSCHAEHEVADLDAVDRAARDAARLLVLNYPSTRARCSTPGPTRPPWPSHTHHGAWLLNDLAYGFLPSDEHRARSVLDGRGAGRRGGAVVGVEGARQQRWSPAPRSSSGVCGRSWTT